MNLNDAFPSKYLKSGDLPEDRPLPVTIEKVTQEEVGKNKDMKFIVHFEELDKGLVLNKTNAKTISKIAETPEFEEWSGTKIHLYRAEVEFQGEMVEAIRVKLKAPTKAKDQDDEIETLPF